MAQELSDSLRVTSERDRTLGCHVERFARRRLRTLNRQSERLGYVVGVHVVQRLHSEVRECDLLAGRQALEHRQLDVPGRVHRHPPRSDDVTWVEQGHWQASAPALFQQELLDRRLGLPVLTEWPARSILGRRYHGAWAVYPDGPAMDQIGPLGPERLDKLPG